MLTHTAGALGLILLALRSRRGHRGLGRTRRTAHARGPAGVTSASRWIHSRRRPMREMTVYGVSFDLVGKQPIVLLKTQDGNTFLPIWIGHPEAAAILMNLQGTEPPRPMTHDLATSIIALARRRDPSGHRHGAPREHLPRADHDRPERHRDRARRAHVRRDRARAPQRREDLRRRRRDRGVGSRVRGRRGGGLAPPHRPGVARRPRSGRVPPLPRHGLARRVRRRAPRTSPASRCGRQPAPELSLRQVEQVGDEPVEPGGRERPRVRCREGARAGAAPDRGRRFRARAAPSAPRAP